MSKLEFKSATDFLTQGPRVTLARIADRFGVQLATIARARITTANRRPPRAGWEEIIAELAETHARELEVRVKELRRLAGELRAVKRGARIAPQGREK